MLVERAEDAVNGDTEVGVSLTEADEPADAHDLESVGDDVVCLSEGDAEDFVSGPTTVGGHERTQTIAGTPSVSVDRMGVI